MITTMKQSVIQCRARAGYSMVELLVAVAVLSILAALILIQGNRYLEKGNNISCISNLRTIGGILMQALQERPQPGVFYAWYSGTEGGEFWNSMLVKNKYLSADDLQKLSCPSIDYFDKNGSYSGRHYGIDMSNTAENLREVRDEEGTLKGRAYRVDLLGQQFPQRTILLADSVTSAGDPTIRIFRSDSGSFGSGAFHARHEGAVNGFFYDGHVENMNFRRLHDLGIRRVYDADLKAVSLTGF